MLLTIATLVAVLAHQVSAHARLFRVSVNGESQGDGANKYIRTPENAEQNQPIFGMEGFASPAITCNTRGGTAAPSFVKAAAGDKLTFQWGHDNPDDPNDYPLASDHKGSVLTYIAPYTSGQPTGPIWSKLAEDSFDGTEWATTKLINNRGKVELALPKSLAPGKYLIRQELLSMHKADYDCSEPGRSDRGAESYPHCVQIEVSGNGNQKPNQNFDFNEGYTCKDKGIFFNIYINQNDKYVPPGPRPWKAE
ncbi:hypothetical protein VTI28DRAFT_8847 [Corynascus sepedonium]